jgi:hypothetical protein
MEYRLGEYQCPACEYTEKSDKGSIAADQPGIRQGAATLQNYEAQSSYVQGLIKDYRPSAEPGPKYDPAPSLSNEKLLLMGLFVIQSIVRIFSAMGSPDSLASALLWQGGTLLMLLVVFFVPFIPLKWLMATLSCLVGMLGFAGLLMGLLALTFFGSIEGLLGWLAGLLNVSVNLWIASVLYRDIQKLQLGE